MNSRPFTVKLTLFFVLLNAIIWLAFGFIIALGLHPALPDQPLIRWGMAIISLLTAVFLALMFIHLDKPKKSAYTLSLAFFVAAAVITIFDDFGWIDLVVVVINLIPLILLLKDRAWYLK
jgi:lysylphosphatidylglycerol synthetase-like protein (DUF2156 family)